MLADDDFEATVFEEAPQAPPVDTALNRIGDRRGRLERRDVRTPARERVIAPPAPTERDETMERAPVAPSPREQQRVDGVGARRAAAAARSRRLGRHQRRARPVRSIADDAAARADRARRATTARRSKACASRRRCRSLESSFVAGEIDVPTPAPEGKAPVVEFTAASSLLANAEPSDPDTGKRTPPLERR